MTQAIAEYLSRLDRDYYAKCIRGVWCVWCEASEHVVEFDAADIDAAARHLAELGG
jgi:hypothetical protein